MCILVVNCKCLKNLKVFQKTEIKKERKKRALMFKLYNNKRTHITQVMFYYSRAIYREKEEEKKYGMKIVPGEEEKKS